jgi:acetolactate synthase-1/2/3 large subunit
MGACLVTTGCAGTNTMTGVLHAWQDSIPCIFVSGQQNVEQTIAYSELPLRQVGVQEANIVELVEPITKYSVMLTDIEDIVWQVDKALYLAQEGRKGPVWIDVPLNIQNAMIDESKMRRFVPENNIQKEYDCEFGKSFEEKYNQAKRPVILAGHGVRSAKAIQELKKVSEKFHIPIVFTRFSADLLSCQQDYNFGVAGAAGANRYANFIIQNSDFVLSVGSRLSIDTTGPNREDFAREAQIVVVDIDKIEHSKNGVHIDQFIWNDAKLFLQEMLDMNLNMTDEEWIEKCLHWKKIFDLNENELCNPKDIDVKLYLRKLSQQFPDVCTVLSDAGMTGVAVAANCKFGENVRFIHSFAQGEMGYVLPGAIGVAAISKAPVLAISGDGSIMMNLQELQTLVRNQYNVKIIINNNNGYSGVRHGQKAHFRGKTIGTDSSNGLDFPDYGKIADAFGIPYCKIETYDQIEEKNAEMLSSEGPYICEVMCDPEQFDLHNALVMYGKRKFGFRPIEDQSPFIDRDVFFKEMIVEPMETSYGKPV